MNLHDLAEKIYDLAHEEIDYQGSGAVSAKRQRVCRIGNIARCIQEDIINRENRENKNG